MRRKAVAKVTSFLDSWLAYRARHVDIPGFSVAVQAGDQIIFSQAYGFANTKRQIPLSPESLFHMASQTKMLTATAIMQFVQAGRLHLDDPACNYLPWLRGHHDQRFRLVTIRHLLSHSAGLLRDGLDSDYWLLIKPCPTKSELQKIILATDLVFSPGTNVKYSNLGLALLGLVIEALGGQPYTAHIKHAIIRPLALGSIVPDYTAALHDRVPTGYGLPFEHHRKAITPRRPARGLVPATGLYATPEAMCRFASALFMGDARLVNDTLKRDMQRFQVKVTGGYDEGTEFGLGHEIQMVGKRRVVGHRGHVAGHVTSTYFDPYDKVAISVASNAKGAPSTNIVRGIFGVLDFFLQATENGTQEEQSSPFSVRLSNEMSTVEVVQSGNRIVAIDPDDWEPFSWYESLEKLDDTTLRITTPGSVYNQGETLRYTFDGPDVKEARLAGLTLRPESS